MKTPTSVALTGAAAVALWLAFTPGSTRAYTVSTLFTPGCHEKITSEALRTVRLTADEQALVDDLQFNLEPDMKDLGGVVSLSFGLGILAG
jgi:hypothetical protein